MDIDPATLTPRDRHLLLTALVVPRPIGWISTLDASGRPNLAPYSFFNLVASSPPTLIVSIGQRGAGPKDTLANLRATGELVVNVVSDDLTAAMNASSVESGRGPRRVRVRGLTPAPSAVVRPPRVAAARAHLEARVVDEIAVRDDDGVASNHVVFARIVHVHVDDAILTPPHRIDTAALAPVARLAGTAYGRLGELFSLARPGGARGRRLKSGARDAVLPGRGPMGPRACRVSA
jgi:flavin reductase (DIM6/NTAB) family NADH-FMN oxidoreductase RutF